ncbi:MAG: valine--pyruvate transaminase, partial [Candidatus Thioglobus sp.]
MTNIKYSKFGSKFSRENGITRLMDDLGSANQRGNDDVVMLGGGNPAFITEANEVFIDELQKLINNSEIENILGRYDSPQGNEAFVGALVKML